VRALLTFVRDMYSRVHNEVVITGDPVQRTAGSQWATGLRGSNPPE